jgi:hypothetical protein
MTVQLDWKLIVGICGLGFAVFSFCWNRRAARKSLGYQISIAPLTSISHDFKGRLQISFDGSPIGEVSVVSIRIKNNGSTPIRREDFEKPLFCQIAGNGTFLIAEISARTPDSLEPQLLPNVKRIEVQPLLLNRNDEFTIFSLISGFPNAIEIAGRMVGVKVTDMERRMTYGFTTPQIVELCFLLFWLIWIGIGLLKFIRL